MNFKQLIAYIKKQGCRVVVWRNKEYIEGSAGTFHVTEAGPLINIATKNETIKKNTTTLLHEYGHFLQWREGFLPCVEMIADSYDTHYHWLKNNRDLTKTEWSTARNAMLWIEWDAEMRGYRQGIHLGVKGFNRDYYLSGTMSYVISIKWSWDNKSDWKISVPRKLIKRPKIYSTDELFAPLTRAEKALTKHIKR